MNKPLSDLQIACLSNLEFFDAEHAAWEQANLDQGMVKIHDCCYVPPELVAEYSKPHYLRNGYPE